MDSSQTGVEVERVQLSHYRSKYCPDILPPLFATCCVLMMPPVHPTDQDCPALATCTLQRLAVEVALRGGDTCQELTPAVTHVAVYCAGDDSPPPAHILNRYYFVDDLVSKHSLSLNACVNNDRCIEKSCTGWGAFGSESFVYTFYILFSTFFL